MFGIDGEHQTVEKTPALGRRPEKQSIHRRRQPHQPQMVADGGRGCDALAVNAVFARDAGAFNRRLDAGTERRQTERAFSRLGWASVAIVVTLHIVMIAAEPLSLSRLWLEAAVVWTALIALGARALEAGLQPSRDVERYEQYRANILVASERFEAADGLAGKLEVMRGFERNSLEEMRIFMRTHKRSSFML